MPRVTRVDQHSLLEAALEGLQARKQRIEEEIAQIMSPRHFVDVRRTHGGPAPSETTRAIVESRQALDRDGAWVAGIEEALAAAETRLQDRVNAL